MSHIGPYLLVRHIGGGGQGDVYEAYAPDGQRVAIKLARDDGISFHDMARELEAVRQVPPFCTARVVEAVVDGSPPYIVSEYVDGPNLGQWVTERRVSEADLERLAVGLATALTAIHGAGVIHRDLKPANVLIGPDGPRVIDFGIARTLNMPLTATGEIKGTVHYTAPEVLDGERASTAGDVFAWGAVMVFAASGADPFRGDSVAASAAKVLRGNADLTALPASLRRLVASALSRDPSERPSAHALLLALVAGDAQPDMAKLMAVGSRHAADLAAPVSRDPDLGSIAEELFSELGAEEQVLVPGVLLRLIAVTESGELVTRRAERAELPPDISSVLDALQILIASDDQQVWLAKPALLHAWPRLRGWVRNNREEIPQVRVLWDAASRWDTGDRDPGDLWHGNRLDEAQHWALTRRGDIALNQIERDFLDTSAAGVRRSLRRARLSTGVLAVFLVLAILSAGVAFYQTNVANSRSAVIAQQRNRAEGLRLAALADTVRSTEPKRAMRLSLAAWRLNPGPTTRAALTTALAQPQTRSFRDPATASETIRRLTPDGRILVSVGEGAARVYDLRQGKRIDGIDDLKLGDESLVGAAISPSGHRLVVVTSDTVRLYDLVTKQQVRSYALGFGATRPNINDYTTVVPSFGSSERYAMIGTYIPELWDLDSGRRLKLQRGAIGPVNQTWAIVDEKGNLDFHSIPAGNRTLRINVCSLPCKPASAQIDENGDRIAVNDGGGYLRILSPKATNPISVPSADEGWNQGRIAFSQNGALLASVSDSSLQVIRVLDGKILLTLPVTAFSADTGLSGVIAFDPQRPILRYIAESQVIELAFTQPSIVSGEPLADVTLSPNARVMAVQEKGSHDVELKDLSPERHLIAKQKVDPLNENDVENVATFSPDGRLFAISRDSSKISILDARSCALLGTITPADRSPHPGWTAGLYQIALSHDGSKLAFLMDRGAGDTFEQVVQVWNWRSSQLLWSKDIGVVQGLAFTPDDQAIAIAGADNRLRDIITGEPQGKSYGGVGEGGYLLNVFYPSDGTMVTFDTTGRLARWSASTHTQMGSAISTGLTAWAASRSVVAISSHNLAAISSPDGQTILFDVAAGIALGPLTTFRGTGATDLAFTNDGTALVSADSSGHIRRQTIDPDNVVAALCKKAGRGLTPAEWKAELGDVSYINPCSA
ncbi:protein kinase [Streptosporangiaceae bacterium NEAU-GS5]|nr:protein kinase [Streptosporangiaceae bacterium NEAU-GS5]